MKNAPGIRVLGVTALDGPGDLAPRRSGSSFLVAMESAPLLDELRRLLVDLLGAAEVEVVPQDGPVALNRLRGARPRLAFLPMDLRSMEGLTLVRALPEGRARQVVLLVPDTVDGYRVAWEGLCLGARDFMVTRGVPPQRFKGATGARMRQLAHLLAADEGIAGTDLPALPTDDLADADESDEALAAPWLLLPESRHLAGIASWLRALPASAPVVVRVPEGPRFLRVLREGLGRLVQRPVRELSHGDRLVPGHVHLVTDLEVPQLTGETTFVRAGLAEPTEPPGTWGARQEVLRALLDSPVPLCLALPDSDLTEQEDLLADAGCHRLFRLEPGPFPGAGAEPGTGPDDTDTERDDAEGRAAA